MFSGGVFYFEPPCILEEWGERGAKCEGGDEGKRRGAKIGGEKGV